MSIPANVSFLNQLYTSLCASSVPGYTSLSVQSYITTFLNNPGSSGATAYNNMTGAINAWLSSTTIPQTAVGLPLISTVASTQIPGLRVQVIETDGTTAYDSAAAGNNLFSNINIPDPNFLTNGKYLIGENKASRVYNMGAFLSQTGVFSLNKFSNNTGQKQLYLAIRIGTGPHNPVGNIVISINA